MDDILELQGKTLVGKDAKEVIIKEIISDSGMTSVVYVGSVQGRKAAIKILLPGSSKIVREYFRSERINMIALKGGWIKIYPDEECVVPEVLEYSDEGQFPFLAIEFIDGTPLKDFLQQRIVLSEKNALDIALQFGKLLNILHSETHQTYADIKFENLWIEKSDLSNDVFKLKVSDWNILANYSDDGVKQDLFYASLYLLRLVLNDLPGIRGIRIHGRIDRLERFSGLTLATQNLLRRLLNNNLEVRPRNASEWIVGVRGVFQLWSMTEEQLRSRIQKTAQTIEENKDTDRYSKQDIANLYQILKASMQVLLSRVETEEEARPIRTELDSIQMSMEKYSNLDVGLTFLRGSNFDQAIDQFLKGAEISLIDREQLMRWYWYALGASQAGRQIYQNVRDEIIGIGKYHAEGEYRRVISGFQKMDLPSIPEAWQHLFNEAKIYVLAQDAQDASDQNDFLKEIKHLQEAIKLFDSLPAKPETNWVEYRSDLHELLEEAYQKQQTTGQFNQLMKDAEERHKVGDHEAAVNALRSAALLKPEKKFDILEKWLAYTQEGLEKDDPAAYVYIDQGITTGHIRNSMKDFYKYLSHYRRAKEMVSICDYESAFKEVKVLWQSYSNIERMVAFPILQRFIIDLYKLTLVKDERLVSNEMLSFFAAQNVEWAQNKMQRVNDENVDIKLKTIFNLSEEKSLSSFSQAKKLVDQIVTFLGNNHPKVIENKAFFNQIEETVKELSLQAGRDEEKLKDLKNHLEGVKNELTDIKNYKEESLQFFNQHGTECRDDFRNILPVLENEYAELLGNAVVMAYEYENIYQEIKGENTEKYLEYFFNLIGESPDILPTLLEVVTSVNNKEIFEDVREKLSEQAREMIELGSPYQAIDLLQLIWKYDPLNKDEQDALVLAKKAITLQTMNQTSDFADLEIDAYSDLPSIYWSSQKHIEEFYRTTIEKDLMLLRQSSSVVQDISTTLSRIINSRCKLHQLLLLSGDKEKSSRRSQLKDVVNQAISFVDRPTRNNENALLRTIDGLPKGTYEATDVDNILKAQTRDKKEKSGKKYFKVATIILSILVLILTSGLILQRIYPDEVNSVLNNIFMKEQASTEVIVEITPEVQETSLPEITPTPAVTETLVEEEILETPIVTPTSIYGVSDNVFLSQPWEFPDYGDISYIIDNPIISCTDPSIIQEIEDQGYSNHMSTIEGTAASMGYIKVLWELDVPLEETGLFEIYVSDPIQHGGFFSSEVGYIVSQDQNAIQSMNGDGKAIFKTNDKQTVNEWISLGVYRLEAGLTTQVSFESQEFTLALYEEFPIDSIMFVKLQSPNMESPLINDFIEVKNENLLYWVDDTEAQKVPDGVWDFSPINELLRNQTTWQGELSTTLTGEMGPISVTYLFPQKLWGLGNRYKIGFWVSPNLQTETVYELFIDDVSTGEKIAVTVSEDLGVFRFFNMFEIDDEEQHEIKVVMTATWPTETAEEGQTFEAVCDVVVITTLLNANE